MDNLGLIITITTINPQINNLGFKYLKTPN